MTIMLAKILLTLSTLGYSAIPAMFDLNETHATNPRWVGHARFHVVWQVASYICIGLIALVFIWWPGDLVMQRLWIAAALAAAAYTGFFTAVFTKPLYNGENYDPNGVLPVRPPIIGRYVSFEVNITLFSITSAILASGAICLALAGNT